MHNYQEMHFIRINLKVAIILFIFSLKISGFSVTLSILEEVPVGFAVQNVSSLLNSLNPSFQEDKSILQKILLIGNENFKIIDGSIIVSNRIDRENPETCKMIFPDTNCKQNAQLLVELKNGTILLFTLRINILGKSLSCFCPQIST